MTDFPNRIIHILRGCPNGLTSKDIAERLGTTRRNLSSRLSKLARMELLTGFEAQWPNTAQREQFTEHLAMRLRMARFKQRIDPKSKRARPMKAPWLRRKQPI